MKIRIYLKDPDTLYDAINDALEEETFGLTNQEEINLLKEKRAESYRELAGEWFEYGEYVMLEMDTEEKTMRVVSRQEMEVEK